MRSGIEAEPRLLPLGVAAPLNLHAIGANLRIVRVEAPAADAARLNALGVCVGRRLSVVKPGDPMIVRVVGARVGLSARLAAAVWVESTAAVSQDEVAPIRAAV
ncbi:MAG: ferrous iron transport protein A [Pirellulales bacterium]|nr:ferrous iron transport protein A [Pirellulales bacterium]